MRNILLKVIAGTQIYLTKEEYKKYKTEIKKSFLNRKSSQGDSLMYSTNFWHIVRRNEKLNLSEQIGISACPRSSTSWKPIEHEITIKARWFQKDEQEGPGAIDANIFGKTSVFQLHDNIEKLNIPLLDPTKVSESFLKKYKASLIPNNQTFEIAGNFDELFLVSYYYGEKYLEDYIYQNNLGGGAFIERHNFPQLFAPMSEKCYGGIILGIETKNYSTYNEFTFTSFQIPYGYSLLIEANGIHGDFNFVGNYTTTLNLVSESSTALLRTPMNQLQRVNLQKLEDEHTPQLVLKH